MAQAELQWTAAPDRMSVLRGATEGLLQMVQSVSGADAASLGRLASALLALPANFAAFPPDASRGRGSAALNPDGFPMEVAVTATSEGLAFRLVADPAAIFVAPALRLALARTALAETLALTRARAIAPLFDAAIDTTLPADEASLDAYRDGPMCIAGAVGGRGAAIYLDARTAGERGWERAVLLASQVLPRVDRARHLLDVLRPHCVLASVGGEGIDMENGVLKLYFRVRDATALSDLGVDLLRDTRIASFAAALLDDRGVPASGLLLGFGLALRDGELRDLKVNYCGHCVALAPAAWEERLSRQCDALGLPPLPVAAMLASPLFDVSFVTLGLTTAGGPKINFYVRPCSGA